MTIRIVTLNVGSMTGRGQEVVDFMERRKINIMCVQETKWKGSKARDLGNGFKLFYIGEDGRRNGVGIILNDEMKKGVLSVKRRSDRIIWVKVALNGEIINIISAYAPQTGCGENEKIKFWEEMDEELRDIPDTEKLWVVGGGTSVAILDGITVEKKKPLVSMVWVRAMKLETILWRLQRATR